MNRNKIKNYQIFSTILVFILGSLFHFTYDWSGQNNIVGIFSAINESVWEHLKLLYFPMVLTILLGNNYIKKDAPNFLCAKTIGILVSMAFTVIFFYTYTGILGGNVAFIDISSFFIATILGEFIAYVIMINKYKCNKTMALLILILLFLCFAIFTFYAPQIGLFEDLSK